MMTDRNNYKKLILYRRIFENLEIFLIQYIGFHFNEPVSFASGTACAFLFMRGYRILPGIALAAYVFYFSSVCSVIFTLQAFFILYLSHRAQLLTLVFYRKWDVIKFAVITTVITALSTLAFCEFLKSSLFLKCWMGNLLGIWLIGCALIYFDAYFSQIAALVRK